MFFQYAFARGYANRHGATLEVPKDWIGRNIFDIKDPPISSHLPRTSFDQIPDGKVNIDLHGYYQKQECLDFYARQDAKAWFTIKPEWMKFVSAPSQKYVACHIRKGDFVSKFSKIYCNINCKSYDKTCNEYGLIEDHKIYFFTDEKPTKHRVFEKNKIGFLYDFILIMKANVILRANSTYSWWAATLSGARVFSPLVVNLTGSHDVKFIEGNWPRLVDGSNMPFAHEINDIAFTDLHLKEK